MAADTEFTPSLISSNMELVARAFDGQETQSRHRHDHSLLQIFFLLNMSSAPGIKVRSVQRLCFGALTQLVPSVHHYT